MTAEEFIKQLEKIDGNLLKQLEGILGVGSKAELLNFVDSDEFDKFLNESGLTKLINDFVNEHDFILMSEVKTYPQELVKQAQDRLIYITDVIKKADERKLLGYFNYKAGILQSELAKSIIDGQTAKKTIERLQAVFTGSTSPDTLHIFTDANVGTVVQTAYTDFARTITVEAFSDKPEQRFYYQEGIPSEAPQKSQTCRWLIENQNPKGYTMTEIKKGLETPFGIVNEHGRQPNFNCTDRWLPI